MGFPHMLVGYMRVSSDSDRQTTDLQRDALLVAGVDERHLFEDRASGAVDDRPGLISALAFDRERHHLLQLRYPFAAGREVRGERQCKSAGPHQEDIAGGLAPHPSERALQIPRGRADHRSRCDHSWAGDGVTEFSRVWAYTPLVGS